MNFSIVLTTLDSKRKAEELAKKIILNNLGKCVQISRIKSYYKWKGRLEKTEEYKLEIKTPALKYKALEKFIVKNNNYELPEITAVKINKGYKKYLDWLK